MAQVHGAWTTLQDSEMRESRWTHVPGVSLCSQVWAGVLSAIKMVKNFKTATESVKSRAWSL